MKKLLPVIALMVIILLTGCDGGSKDLENLGLEKSEAQDFYNYSNTTKELYFTLITINEYLPDKGFKVTNDDYKKVTSLVNDLETYYESLNPKGIGEFQEYLYGESNARNSPKQLINNIEKHSRQFNVGEALMTMDMITYYAKEVLITNDVSNDAIDGIMDWYHGNNNYQNLFLEAYEHRFKK